ncbi:MAG: helix-turn-helix domain-containing protein [Nitrospirales bacterium]
MDHLARTARQIGAVVRRERKRQRLSQAQLGEQIHRRQATISKLEAGEPGTQLQTLLDVLAALDLELVIRPRTKASTVEIEEAVR